MKERNLTEGNIIKTMLIFSLPMIVGNLLQQIYNIADTMIVGHYLGSLALAAVGSAYSLMTFLTSIIIGLCMGSSALFSIAYGAKDAKKLKESIWSSFWFIFLVTIVINGAVFIFVDPILTILQVPDEVYVLLRSYIVIIFVGILFVFIYNFFSCLLRALGDSLTPLIFLGISSLLNIVLDIWFVSTLDRGVSGAAEATVISQIISAIGISVYTRLRRKELIVEKEYRHVNKEVLKQVMSYSLITCAQQSVMNFGILMIQGLVNSFGTVIMAAFAITVKIDTIAYMPAQEFGNAFSLFVSQNYGARKLQRIREGIKQAFAVSILFCLVVSFFIWIFAGNLIMLFLDQPNLEILQEGIRYLHIEGSFYFGIGCLFLFYGLYRAINRPSMSLVLTIISLGTRVILAYALAPNTSLGVVAIWMAIPIGWLLADIIGAVCCRKSLSMM